MPVTHTDPLDSRSPSSEQTEVTTPHHTIIMELYREPTNLNVTSETKLYLLAPTWMYS